MDMWHSNDMKATLGKFAKGDGLNTELCWFFLFLYLIFPYGS